MKRITMIVGLLLVGIALTATFWSGIGGVETAAAIEPPDAVVAADDLNLRSGPGLSFRVLGNYAEGTRLKVLGQGRDGDKMPWLYVQTPDGKKGWMSARPSFQTSKYMQINVPISDIPFVTLATPTPVIIDGFVAVDDLNMRSGPGLGNRVLGRYDEGTPLDILGQSPDRNSMPWLYVQMPDGKKGFVSARPNLRTTPYVQINIPHSQIPPLSEPAASLELEEVGFDTPKRAAIAPIGPKFWLYRLSAVSCTNLCAPFFSSQSQPSGSEVCLEWYEMGTPDSNEQIKIDVRRDGTSLGTGSLEAKGDKLCRAIRMSLPDAGDYEAVVTTNKSTYPHEWTVD